MKNDQWRPAFAELVGSFAFVFIGAGSIVTDSYTHGAVGLLGIALAQGLVMAIMVSSLGHISGGYFNPAITIGLWAAKKVDAATMGIYIGAQLLGSLLAGGALRAIFSPSVWVPVQLGIPALSVGMIPMTGIFLEAILTFFLLLAVLGSAVDAEAPKIGGFGIGLAVTMGVLVGGPVTGAAMNPARVFGPALVTGFWEYHWVYWIGPILGSVAASFLYTRALSKTI